MQRSAAAYCGPFIVAVAFAGLAPEGASAESQYVVVAAEPGTDAVEIGRVLGVGDTINVPAGVVVTLMGESGSVNRLTGPTEVVVTADSGAAAPNDDNRTTLSKLGELLKSDERTADRLGVSRSTRPRTAPDPWAVPLDAKTVCVRDGMLKLVRGKDLGREAPFSIEMDGTPSTGGLLWAAGEEVFKFPQRLAPGTKKVRVQLGERSWELNVVHLPATIDPGPSIETLTLLNVSACTDQMLALAKSMAD